MLTTVLEKIKDKPIEYLKEYMNQIESSEDEKVPALKFLFEKLELIHESKFRRRYSPETHVLSCTLFHKSCVISNFPEKVMCCIGLQ